MTHLAVRFAKHIESTASTNPICLIRPWTTRCGVITRSRSDNFFGSLVNRLSFAILARALTVLLIVCGQDAPTLTDCLCAYHYAKFSQKQNYRLHHTRCLVLWIQDPATLILALGWRCTTIGFQYTCCCGHRFGRSHVSKCHLLDNFPLDLGHVNTKYVFPPGSEYSLLDCLLNHGKFYLFEQCLTYILSSLGSRHPVADNNSGFSRASFSEPELEAHEHVPVLHRPASQQLTALNLNNFACHNSIPPPNLWVQQRFSDNKTSLLFFS
ncbi:hypothetical protein DSO57_1028631 [Entomophthora muscae]|uniref:Uncharacterized protein n=1 Tax=Entomophthora muscae TaxID=34485 RepID=A0ACC2UAU0_9FUNG|nr:hypothetical protein DSO57_1028631 [Entomophthora muscae]